MTRKTIRHVLGASALIGAGLLAAPAYALLFDITSDHCTNGCGTPPFGTVDVEQVGNNVTIAVTLASGNFWAQTGAADFQLFKFNGTDVAVSDIIPSQTFTGHLLVSDAGSFTGDGTGFFGFGITCSDCGNGNLGIASPLDFTVLNATIADVTATNNLGNIFVADIFSGQTGNTGPVDVNPGGIIPPSSIPEPATPLIFGVGLLGLAFTRKLRRGSPE